jgi:hypothetical protein
MWGLLRLQSCALLTHARLCFASGDLCRAAWLLRRGCALLWSSGLSTAWLRCRMAALLPCDDDHRDAAGFVPAFLLASHVVHCMLVPSASAAPYEAPDGLHSQLLLLVLRTLLDRLPLHVHGS